MVVDPQLAERAFEQALGAFPSMRSYAGRAKLVFLPIAGGGGAYMLRYDPPLPKDVPDAWEFQNAVVRAYKALAGQPGGSACG